MERFCVVLLVLFVVIMHCSCQQDGYKDYIVVLTPPSSESGIDAMEFLQEHLDHISKKDPNIALKRIYKNLASMGYLAYSMTTKTGQLSAFGEFKYVQSVEDVTYLNVAASKPEYVPYTPSVDTGDNAISRDGVCTFTYNSTSNIMNIYQQATSLLSTYVYVLDTGIQASHKSFGGRVIWGFDAISSPPLRSDLHGHGTQVARIIGGRNFGISPMTRLVDVRVMDEYGRGRTDDIIAGLDFAIGDYFKHKEVRGRGASVINMSISGPKSKALQYALYMVSRVLLVVGAAGDYDSFTCSCSPVNSGFVLSVAGTTRYSEMPLAGSNYGDCIDAFAPGDSIPAPYIGPSNTEEKELSGSSAAAAIVSGIASRIMYTVMLSEIYLDAYNKHVVDTDIPLFIKKILISTRLAGYYDMQGAHVNAFIDCDIRNSTSLKTILDLDLRLVNIVGHKMIPGLEMSKKRFQTAVMNKKKESLFN